jgi:hypothetical protein
MVGKSVFTGRGGERLFVDGVELYDSLLDRIEESRYITGASNMKRPAADSPQALERENEHGVCRRD